MNPLGVKNNSGLRNWYGFECHQQDIHRVDKQFALTDSFHYLVNPKSKQNRK